MRRRLSRRFAAGSALVAGGTGIAANALLVGYFGLARPWLNHDSPWEWLGTANDIVGSLSMAALVPVIGYVRRRAPADRLLGVLSDLGILACSASALAGPLLVAGLITLETQFVVAGVALPVVFGWLWRACRGARTGNAAELPTGTARFGERVAIVALAATSVAAVGALLPAGSVAQYAVLGLAAIPGLPAYLAFPFWPLAAGRAWWRGKDPAELGPAPAATARSTDISRSVGRGGHGVS